MFVSAPATAFLHASPVHLPKILPEPGESKAATTSVFKNVFSSLTQVDDTQHQASSKKEGAPVPPRSMKKASREDSSSKTQQPLVIQTPSPAQPKPPIALPRIAARASEPGLPPVPEKTSAPATKPDAEVEAAPMAETSMPAPNITLLPLAENFAFAVRLHESENLPPVTPSQSPTPQMKAPDPRQPSPPDSSTIPVTRHAAQPTAPETEKAPNSARTLSESPRPTPEVTPRWNETPVFGAPQASSAPTNPDLPEVSRPNLPVAAQEVHLLAPELPRASTSSEILLHLTGNDQASAAIRVADRAGAVSVSVHASDPVLRESLRSNLSELSTQLNAQGWKADVIRSAAVTAHSEGQSGSRSGEQRSSHQQQSFGGDRQPQRDRHARSGQWEQELDQQISGGAAPPEGNA